MSVTSPIGMKLTMYQSNNMTPLVTLKSKKHAPFIAEIKDFLFDEEDTKVVFKRCDQTVAFPNDDGVHQEEFTTYIKNIKEVRRSDL